MATNQIIAGAAVVQAFATIALVWITCVYVWELQTSRKQQQKPYVYVFFYWTQNLGKFMAVLKNVGNGPAFDINYSYELENDAGKKLTHSDRCRILAQGEETVDMTPFSHEHINAKNNVKLGISYKDSFGQVIKDCFEHSLRELANNPPPSKYAEFRRSLEKEPSPIRQEAREGLLIELLSKTAKALEGIRDELRKK